MGNLAHLLVNANVAMLDEKLMSHAEPGKVNGEMPGGVIDYKMQRSSVTFI